MAGLIPQGFIDELLNRIDLVEVVSERVSLKKSGRNYTACCPFHQEKTPSFSVSPDKQFFYCFGCGAGGNAIGFVMDHDQLDFPEAVETLAQRAGLEVPREQGNRQSQQPRQPAQSPLYGILQNASDFYCSALSQHPARQNAVNYLNRRGINKDIADDFLIGYAPPGWDNLLRELGGDNLKEQYLLEAGLLAENEDSGRRYDRFRDRIIFPIRDSRGRVIGFGGRVLGDDKPKYLNSPETPVFHKGQELYGLYEARQYDRQLKEILVVEGYMDVIALAQQGLRNAVATLGTATTPEHIKRLLRVTSSIVFCFDGDNAGRKAAWRALDSCLEHMKDGVDIRFLFLPDGSDPDDLVRSEGADNFRERIAKQSLDLPAYFFRQLSEDTDLDSTLGKAKLSADAVPLITRIPGEHVKRIMLADLQKLTGLDISLPSQAPVAPAPPVYAPSVPSTPDYDYSPQPIPSKQYQPRPATKRYAAPASSDKRRVEPPIEHAIRTLLLHPKVAKEVAQAKILADEDDQLHQLLVSMLEYLQKHLAANTNPEMLRLILISRWQSTDHGSYLLSLAQKEWLIEDSNIERQFFDTITKLEAKQIQKQIHNLLEQSKQHPLSSEQKQTLSQLYKTQLSAAQNKQMPTTGNH